MKFPREKLKISIPGLGLYVNWQINIKTEQKFLLETSDLKEVMSFMIGCNTIFNIFNLVKSKANRAVYFFNIEL